MRVKDEDALSAEHDGQRFVFCSAGCHASSRLTRTVMPHRRPTTTVNLLGLPGRGRGEEVEYTCPMHPEIRQMGPGACPICGMGLEPATVTADTAPAPSWWI
ncbi:hypothetical protein L0A91_16390 (plasmid) [Ornithinimicrobium sp. INDO-MA30-4]|nr:hypothetical protein L0A91_16390 [Ornithinimicrobium sp. INDO-MA30-4]